MAIELIRLILQSIKDPKLAIMVIGMGAFAYYAMAEHRKAVDKIERNTEKLALVNQQTAVVVASLNAIKEAVGDVKNTVQKTDDRVWQIGRDVFILKQKASN